MGKRGRRREHKYNSIAETLMDFEEKKKTYLSFKEKYLLYKLIVFNLSRIGWQRLETVYVRRDQETGNIIERKKRDFGLTYREAGKDKYDVTYDLGESFIIDLDHKPPRLRILLQNGKRKDIPLECPRCGDFENKIFVEARPSKQPTKAGVEFYLDCPGGHLGWKLKNVKTTLHELGLIH